MNVIEWLERVKLLDELIDSKQAELDRITELATNTTAKAPDGMPFSNTGNVSDPTGNGAVDLVTLAGEKQRLIDTYTTAKEEVIRMLEQLPLDEYKVLHRHYIRYMKWGEVARDISYSYTSVWRIKNKALVHLEELLKKEKGGQF